MKRNQKKETKSRRPLKRFIALWVVFAMLVVPFANHVGKDDAKAEESEDSYKGVRVSVETKDVVCKNGDISLTQNDAGEIIEPENGPKEETFTLLEDAQEFSWYGTNFPNETEEGNKIVVYFKEYDTSDTPTSKISDMTDMTENGSAPRDYVKKITTSKKLAIYVGKKDADGNVDSCILYYIVNVKFLKTGFSASDTRPLDGSYKKAEDVNIHAGSSELLQTGGTKVRYYVTTDSAVPSDELKNIANYNLDTVDLSAYTKQDVYVYAAITDVYGNVLYEYKSLGHVKITADDQAPKITCTDVSEKTEDVDNPYVTVPNEKNDFYAPDTKIYYGMSQEYKYTFEIEDQGATADADDKSGVDASTIKAKLIKEDGTEESFTIDSSNVVKYPDTGKYTVTIILPADKAVGGTVKMTASDNIGLEGSGESEIHIQQVEPTELKLKSVEFVEAPSNASIKKETDNSAININGTKTVQAVFQTTQYSALYNVAIEDDKSSSYVAGSGSVDVSVGIPTKQRMREITVKFNVPADMTTETAIKNLKMKYAVQADTEADKEISLEARDIVFDPNPPVIGSMLIEASTDSAFSALKETKIADTAVDASTYFTQPDVSYYRYKVCVEDTGSGVNKVYATVAGTDVEFDRIDGTNQYVYVCKDNDLSETNPFSLRVYATDNAGNTTLMGTTLRGIQKVNTSIKADYVILKSDGTTELTQDEISTLLNQKYTNQKYKIRIDASSGYKIANIELNSTAGKMNGSLSGNDETERNNNQNRYKASATFDIPSGNVNEFFDKLYFVVTDTKTPDAQSRNYPGVVDGTQQYLGGILYDHTKPELSGVNAPEDKWYQEYKLNYTLRSGNDSSESPLKIASYAVSNGKENPSKDHASEESKTSFSGSVEIPESQSEQGTLVTFNAADVCLNEMTPASYYIKVDKTRPEIDFDVNGKKIVADPIEGDVAIKANVSDNLTIQTATIRVQGPNTDVTKSVCDAGRAQNNQFTLDNLLGRKAEDGKYTVTVYVADKAGNSRTQSIDFTVDNTTPVVTAKIEDGTTAGKQPGKNFDGTDCDYFYRSNVSVLLTFEDVNIRGSKVTVTDNGSRVNVDWAAVQGTNKYQGIYTATGEGAHTIRIDAIDEAGNQAVTKQVVFIKDTAAPAITAVINGGMIYNENMGEVDLTSNSVVSFSVNDANEDVGDFNYQLIKTLPDQLPVTADVLKTDNRSFGFADEADYVVKAYSIDRAGNRSADKTVQFRIDKTAPELTISGAASGSTLKAGTTLTFSMTEAFWKDASGTITITRKASDSAAESTYKTIDFKPTARVTTLTESLTETGEYKVTFTGKDRAGHTAEATSYTVRIDTGKPIITLSGVSNNDKTTKEVEFQAQIDEDFYLTKSVRVNATRTYLDTTSYKEKTENIQVTGYNPSAPSTIIRSIFTEDGVYKLQITCSDAAGNEDTQEVSFTIDKTKPVIDEKVLSAYAGTLTSFAWDYDLNDIIYDLTVCDVHMYLNGSEYDGTSEIEDGAYEMKITAEDELGNKAEETVNFNLDTKAPTFIVTGVEDGEIKNAQYDINVSLQLDEDILDEVSLNGSPIEIKDNAATLTVADKGDYKLTMKAHDAAGNVAEKTIGFTYGEKSHVLLYVLIGVGALVLIGGGGAAFTIAAKKKKSK